MEDGEEVLVVPQRGQVPVAVKLTEDVMPGVASLSQGWDYDRPGTRIKVARAHAGVNANILSDCRMMDPSSGNGVLDWIPESIRSITRESD